MSILSKPSVLAIVVTYKRPDVLHSCLKKLLVQKGHGLTGIHIVINSADSGTRHVVESIQTSNSDFITYKYCNNEGPAGGIYYGLDFFLNNSNADYAWLMDDDVLVAENCLSELLKCAEKSDYVYPRVITGDGSDFFSFGWSAVLLKRKVIKLVGLPIKDFFYWTEDTEYLQNRIMRVHGINYMICNDARVQHLHVVSRFKPSWFYYYSVRNTLYYRTYIAGYTWYRFRRTIYLFPYTFYSILFKEKNKLLKLGLFFYGTWHGLTGKIGKLIDPEKYK